MILVNNKMFILVKQIKEHALFVNLLILPFKKILHILTLIILIGRETVGENR